MKKECQVIPFKKGERKRGLSAERKDAMVTLLLDIGADVENDQIQEMAIVIVKADGDPRNAWITPINVGGLVRSCDLMKHRILIEYDSGGEDIT